MTGNHRPAQPKEVTSAVTAPTPEQIRETQPGELLNTIAETPDLDLLAWPDDVVLALPTEALLARRDKLLASPVPCNANRFRTVYGGTPPISVGHFARLRNAFLRTGVEDHDALPAPDPMLSDDDIKKPGDDPKSGRKSGSPRWTLGQVLGWLTRYERRHPDTLIIQPRRSGPRSDAGLPKAG